MAGYNPSGDIATELRRKTVATAVIGALESQSGLDTLPAQVSMARILTGVFKKTGVKFKPLGHGRMRWTFDFVTPGEDLGIVLKLGSKQATARDIALTLAFPEDRAQIFAVTEYGVVAERVGPCTRVFVTDAEFDVFIAERFQGRYIGVGLGDLGQIGDRIVMIGSSTRVIKKDAAVKGSASQQIRTA